MNWETVSSDSPGNENLRDVKNIEEGSGNQ
jgi:hypothetical protein